MPNTDTAFARPEIYEALQERGRTAIQTAAAVGDIPDKTRAARVPELDGLRGVAIILVIAYHYFYHEGYFTLGWSGVDLFFVLSGFLIGGILLDVRASPRYFRTFYLRRLFRIIPIYYAWIGAYALLMLFASSLLRRHALAGTAAESQFQIVTLLLFLQNFGIGYSSRLAAAWFVPAWSLAVEEQFYLIAPFVIRLVSRANLYWLLGAVIAMAPVLRLWFRYHFPMNQAASLSLSYTLMPCRADALAIGILTALLWRNKNFKARLMGQGYVLYAAAGVFLIAVAVVAARSSSTDSLLMQSVGYTLIAALYSVVLLLALSLPAGIIAIVARTRSLREVGQVSYCLYLIHDAVRPAIGILAKSVFRNPHGWQLVAWNIVSAATAYAIARSSWKFFEYPLLLRGHNFKY